MFEYFQRYINIKRWYYATDCVTALYGIQLTSNSIDVSSANDTVDNAESQQKSDTYEK